jgi:hypothetical protein
MRGERVFRSEEEKNTRGERESETERDSLKNKRSDSVIFWVQRLSSESADLKEILTAVDGIAHLGLCYAKHHSMIRPLNTNIFLYNL